MRSLSAYLLLPVLARDSQGWHPGIGDPTPMGWVTVLAYFAAGYLCLRAWLLVRRRAGEAARRLAMGWGALACLMLLLGLNKQLDLQSWLTEVGKAAAMTQGWYEQRRGVQLAFILLLVGGGTSAALAGLWYMRQHLRRFWLAGLGAAFIVLFVLIRASSFHHVDVFLSDGPAGIRMNWLLELGGIACVAVAARIELRRGQLGARSAAGHAAAWRRR